MATHAAICSDTGWLCAPVYDATGNETLARVVGWVSEKPLQIAAILALAYIANVLIRLAIRSTGQRMARNADRLGGYIPGGLRTARLDGRSVARAATMSTIARSMATGIVVVVAAGWILAVLGVSLAAIFASAGVLGVALGFGAQNLVRDVLAGWFILVEDRYGVGDVIDVGSNVVGTVERVTLRSTRLRDLNGTVWHVANGELVRVGNKSQTWSRAVIDVTVAPDADIDRACRILAEVGEDLRSDPDWSEQVTSEPDVLGVLRIEALGVTLRVVADTSPGGQGPVEREYRRRVLRSFDAEHIPLPGPYVPTPYAPQQAVPPRPGGAAPGDGGADRSGST